MLQYCYVHVYFNNPQMSYFSLGAQNCDTKNGSLLQYHQCTLIQAMQQAVWAGRVTQICLSPASTPCDADCHHFPSFFSPKSGVGENLVWDGSLQMLHIWSQVHNGLITTLCRCQGSSGPSKLVFTPCCLCLGGRLPENEKKSQRMQENMRWSSSSFCFPVTLQKYVEFTAL